MTKRLVLFSALVLAGVFSLCYWGLAPSKSQIAEVAVATSAKSKEWAAPRPVVASAPVVTLPASTVRRISDERKIIFDSPNVLAMVNAVRVNGSQDEKDWALSLYAVCTQIIYKPAAVNAELDANKENQAASAPDAPELTAKKNRASTMLSKRCEGFDGLNADERRAIRHDLSEGHAANQSTLGQMNNIHDDRWNENQAKIITQSLYSGDPILAKTAFLTVMSSFDSAVPGGGDRQQAFTLALAPIYLNFPLSDFERLDACRSMGWCGSYYGPDPDSTQPSPAIARLADKYRAAVQAHEDARELLAIR